uniref:Uncharacterized protein n=1 Tax=Romanomermis culicivorax TaxID=13658 RepID=A0A915IWL6_ROMCU
MAQLKRMIEGYAFWTVFSALPPMIWFYPMNKLDLTGYEALVVVLFSPILLKIEFLSKILRKTSMGAQFVDSMIVLSLLSFQMPTTLCRLCTVAFGAFWAALKMAIDFSSSEDDDRDEIVMGYTTGYVAVLTSRIFYKTITPAFNDHFSNWTIFVVCATNIFFSSLPAADKETPRKRPPLKCSLCRCYLGTAAGFGSLLYVKLSIFGEMSVPFRWFNDSKQDHSTTLDSNPNSLLILACLICGYFIGDKFPLMILHPLWSLAGLLSFSGIYKLSDYEGLLSACILAIFVGSLWSIYSRSFLECCRPAMVFTGAMFFYLLPAFYAVWTVAYNFVPLGTPCLSLSKIAFFPGWLMFFISLDLFARWCRQDIISFNQRRHRRSAWLVILSLFLLSCGGMYNRFTNWTKLNSSKNITDIDHVTAMIWTYHFGYDNDGWPSLERTANLIKDIDADIVGLLETDASRLVTSLDFLGLR